MSISEVPVFDHVLVVGNGFDLDLGLPTSYSAFLESPFFEPLVEADNETALYLKNKHGLQNWVDIEGELPNLSLINKGRTKLFRAEFKELRNSLIDYIRSINLDSADLDCAATNIVSGLMQTGQSVCICTFNYTFSVGLVLAELGNPTGVTQYMIHGRATYNHANRGRVVFGVQDSAGIEVEHSFLLKSASPTGVLHDDWLVGQVMAAALKSVTIFGHSLGPTDHSQFKYFFDLNRNSNAIQVRVYYHSVDSHDSLMSQLYQLTGKRLFEFRAKHDFQMCGTNYVDL